MLKCKSGEGSMFQLFSAFAFKHLLTVRLTEELRDRTKRFASRIVRLYVALPRQRREAEVLGHQLLRSGTSVAAHIREASRARSDAEFCSKLEGALQEADESNLWLELLRDDCGIMIPDLQGLIAEADELIAIFVTIIERTRRKNH
jgi:four helix bundle protein